MPDPPPRPPKSLLLACQRGKHVHFNLPTGHTGKDITNYQQRKRRGNDDITRCVRATLDGVRQGVLNGSIPLAVSDTAATSNAFLPSAPTLPTGTMSTAVFHLLNRATAAATMIHKLHHNLEKIRPWIPAFLTYILRFCREGGVYKRYFWASASSETCVPGGSYFVYSVFLGVMLAWSMQSPESLFFDLQQLY